MLAKKEKEIIEKYDNAFKPLGIKTLNHYTGELSNLQVILYLKSNTKNISLEQRQENNCKNGRSWNCL